MLKRKFYYLLLLNSVLVVLNVILLSEGLVGWSLNNPALIIKGCTIALYCADVIIFVAGNYLILNARPKIKLVDENKLIAPQNYIDALEQCKSKPEFKDEAEITIKQIKRLAQKVETLKLVLNQHFRTGTMTYNKFSSTILGVNQLFFDNVKKMVNRMSIFNQDEYNHRNDLDMDETSKKVRDQIFNEHIQFVESTVKKNENILLKLDNLLLEISKLNEENTADINDLITVQEINSLIEQTKYYKSQT